jgi:hypothetical protein
MRMAIPNRISAELPQTTVAEIQTAFSNAKSKMPFLDGLNLTDEQRDALNYLKAKNLTFTKNTLELVAKETGFLPQSFPLAEFKKDAVLYDALTTVELSMKSLLQQVSDAKNVAGSEAYAAALAIYDYAKAEGVSTPGLEPYLDDLSIRFTRKKSSKPTDSSSNTTKTA